MIFFSPGNVGQRNGWFWGVPERDFDLCSSKDQRPRGLATYYLKQHLAYMISIKKNIFFLIIGPTFGHLYVVEVCQSPFYAP